ncbi:MAG: hypothetical protein E7323_01200 [Clostridiales bacterium]|nr:hypothetical protein [Clostridiales bacterium]
MKTTRTIRMIALCLSLILLLSSCSLLGIKTRKSDPMLINGVKVKCYQLDSGDYYSGSIRSLVNYLGMQADFAWYTIPVETLPQGGHLYATLVTDRIVDSMNYFAWDYRPNDTDVPRMQMILERYGFTKDHRVTSQWLEENIQQAIQLADDIQKEAMGFATYSRDTANCQDTSRFVPAFEGKEAHLFYPCSTIQFKVNDTIMEAISWSGTNGLYESRTLHHVLRAFDLTGDLDARNLSEGSFTASPGANTAALVDTINHLAWDKPYVAMEAFNPLRAFLLDSGLDAETPIHAEWLCAHMDQAIALYETLPLFFQRWCASVPLHCTDETILSYCPPS